MPFFEGQRIESPAFTHVKTEARAEALRRNITFKYILFQALNDWLTHNSPDYPPCPHSPNDLLAKPKGRRPGTTQR
jgi:hypothetical protein